MNTFASIVVLIFSCIYVSEFMFTLLPPIKIIETFRRSKIIEDFIFTQLFI